MSSSHPPKVRLVQGQEVSLGCGTLVLIALIVLIFCGRGSSDVEREIRRLRSEVGELKSAIEAQSAEFRRLRDRLPPAKADGGKE
jgi:Sec-independent protein translocase protein TatA